MSSTTRRPLIRSLIFAIAITLTPQLVQAAGPTSKAAPKAFVVSGEHRGYTNDELYLRLASGKEMTFTVRIPADENGDKWHKAFETLSQITVTYHQEPGEKRPIVTSIKAATQSPKR